MIRKRRNQINGFVAACLLFTSTCSWASTAPIISPEIVIVGSTPGDATIKSMLAIPADKPVDFIRWDLLQNENRGTFVLKVLYGVGKPNTPDFEGGGEKHQTEGSYTVLNERKSEVYKLVSDKARGTISLVKLNEDLFHVLSPESKLMVGNGGWSYTLTRKGAAAASTGLPRWTTKISDETADSVIFDGRTPCREFVREYDLTAVNECFKLKWKLTLFRDPKTKAPTFYKLEYTLHRSSAIEGRWSIVTGTKENPKATIYRLDPDKPDKSISFLVGDENILFFMNKEGRLFNGNADFSYTLGKRDQ